MMDFRKKISHFYSKNKFLVVAFLILLLGIGLRILNLTKYGLWHDEVLTVLQSQHIAAINVKNLIVPLCIFFFWFWEHIGNSENNIQNSFGDIRFFIYMDGVSYR